LQDHGAKVDYNDDYVTTIPKVRKYNFNKKSVKITPANVKKYDLILLSTEHSYYDYSMILKYAKLIVDTRNGFGSFTNKKIYKA